MADVDWTDEENDLIVADYFAILDKDIAGQKYSKTEHHEALLPQLNGRSKKAIKWKYHNISAILAGLGKVRIKGYTPALNFQTTLADAVLRWLEKHDPAWLDLVPERQVVRDAASLSIGPPPTLSNRPPPKELEKMQEIARKFDAAGRDKRNRDLGLLGEEFVYEYERASLKKAGYENLAAKVRWVSQEDGDGAGYDIASFERNGQSRLIEVKTTNGWERTPFYITPNELRVSEKRRSEWCLFRLWNFSRKPKAFELRPPLDTHVSLIPTMYQANFREE